MPVAYIEGYRKFGNGTPKEIAMTATHAALAKDVSQENREDHPVVRHLQRQVANALVLYANYKHYHWQTFGPLF